MALNFNIEKSLRKPLRLDGVTKRYGRDQPVLEGLDGTFAPGTATGLIGPNGSGKTTLLRLLATVAYPSEGRIIYGDLDVHAYPHRYLQHVGLVYADAGLPQHLSAVELLEWILREREGWSADAPDHIATVLDHVLLDERRHNLIGTYSSGMIQKAQVAAALIAEPAVLLMDEPFRGLDAESTAAVMAILQAFKAAGGLLIVSSHARILLDTLCDTFIDMQPQAAQVE